MQQPAHRLRAAEIVADFTEDARLRGGKREAERVEKRLDEMIVPRAGQAARVSLKFSAARLDLRLQFDELVEREAAAGDFHVGHFFREVEQVNGAGQGGQRGRGFLRLHDLRLELLERPPDQPAQPALRQPLGERINRRDAVEVDGDFLAGLDVFRLGMVDGARLERIGFAENHHVVADREILFEERQVPPAAMQPRRAVVENELEDGLGALGKIIHALRDDLAARGRGHAELQILDREKMAAVLVAARTVEEEIVDGENFQPRQLRRAFGADAGQSGHG